MGQKSTLKKIKVHLFEVLKAFNDLYYSSRGLIN